MPSRKRDCARRQKWRCLRAMPTWPHRLNVRRWLPHRNEHAHAGELTFTLGVGLGSATLGGCPSAAQIADALIGIRSIRSVLISINAQIYSLSGPATKKAAPRAAL
jgi:hypothetical protein